MCRSIKPLQNLAPPATPSEVHEAALQYVRKVGGTTKPAQVNAAAFEAAVAQVEAATRQLLDSLVTAAPPRDRAVEAVKAKARSEARFGR